LHVTSHLRYINREDDSVLKKQEQNNCHKVFRNVRSGITSFPGEMWWRNTRYLWEFKLLWLFSLKLVTLCLFVCERFREVAIWKAETEMKDNMKRNW